MSSVPLPSSVSSPSPPPGGEYSLLGNGDSSESKSPDVQSLDDGSVPSPSVSPNQSDGTNLIVNYIPVSVSEDELRELFAPYGPIERVKIVTDKFTGFSLGYGFVKYQTPEAAMTAVQGLNGHSIQSKRLKVSISKPPEKDRKTNLYISGLPAAWSQQDLENLVKPFGNVLECRILMDMQTRRCKGVGFARFESQKSALTAISSLTGITVDGGIMPLIVKYADTTSDKVRKAMAQQQQQMPPYGMNPQQQQMNAMNMGSFPSYGQRVGPMGGNGQWNVGVGVNGHQQHQRVPVSVAMHGQQAQHVGVHQSHHSSSQVVHPSMNMASAGMPTAIPSNSAGQPVGTAVAGMSPLGGAIMQPMPTMPAGPSDFTGVCLFVYHLPLEATEATLIQLFSNYGVVTSAKVMRDLLTSRSKGFGFVNLLTEQQAQNAINGLNGFQLGSKYLKVAFKK